MKRLTLGIMLLIGILTLSACGEKDITQSQTSAAQASTADTSSAQAESVSSEVALLTEEEVATLVSQQYDLEPANEADDNANEEESVSLVVAAADEDRPIDLDLTAISGTVVYSQVYDMMMNPDSYMGQKIRMKGNFNYYQDPDTKQEYFAVLIADATACCAQGIEFVWEGEHTYPKDYPPLDTELTVTGTFSTYYEGNYMYIQLVDADVKWKSPR